MRVVVVEPPPPGGKHRPPRDALAVGAFDWLDPEPVATVIVKLTYAITDDGLTLAKSQIPLAASDVPVSDRPGEVAYPHDFAPYKPGADLLVFGHAYTTGGPSQEIPVRVTIGEVDVSALAMASASAMRIPLRRGALFTSDAEHPMTLGPSLVPTGAHVGSIGPDFDYAVLHAAPKELRRGPFALGETLRLVGLTPRGERTIDLPREAPRVLVSFRGTLPDAELAMQADTLWIDTDTETFVIVWRGMIGTPRGKSVARIAVSIEEEGEPRDWPTILRSAARGTFRMSVGPDGGSPEPVDEDERDRIAAARADLTLGEVPPEPLLTVDDYTRISAELAEKREPRADVLARAGLDETTWTVEERAWLEAMADRAQHGDGTLTAEIGEKFMAAQDALADPSEAKRTRADWAEITALLEVAEDVQKELDRRKLTLPVWMRLHRRVQREAEEDEAVADEIDRLLAEARERAEMQGIAPGAEDEDEDEPETRRPAFLDRESRGET